MKRILPVIVISQFFCTSLWFAGNAVMSDIAGQLHLEPAYLAHLTSAVQSGFIAGTLIFAVLSISDRWSPSLVFFSCSIIAAVINLAIGFKGITITELILFRCLTGFFLAGIYPVGMKIASDYYQQGLGKALGFLVGALVLGTAFPHLLRSMTAGVGATAALPWPWVIFSTSFLSALGGLLILLLVPDGPYRRPGQRLKLRGSPGVDGPPGMSGFINAGGFLEGFRDKRFRAAAFGYFGHMWELYAFWVFVPVMLTAHKDRYPETWAEVPFFSFLIIAAGGVSCVLSGWVSGWLGAKRTATIALSLSCLCCMMSPLFLFSHSTVALVVFLFIWSMAVIADSPMFSTLVAQHAPGQSKGTSLTIVNCIGFSVTIISIQLINGLRNEGNAQYIYMLLAIGPLLGLLALARSKERRPLRMIMGRS